MSLKWEKEDKKQAGRMGLEPRCGRTNLYWNRSRGRICGVGGCNID